MFWLDGLQVREPIRIAVLAQGIVLGSATEYLGVHLRLMSLPGSFAPSLGIQLAPIANVWIL